jgi:hypothetical protein
MLVPMLLFLPFWLTFGRGIFGSGGWGTLISAFIISPALFVALITLNILVKVRRPIGAKPTLGQIDSLLFTALYISVFAVGFFFVDGGDTTDSVKSVATNLFGRSFQQTSQNLSNAFFIMSLLFICALLTVLTYERIKQPLQ